MDPQVDDFCWITWTQVRYWHRFFLIHVSEQEIIIRIVMLQISFVLLVSFFGDLLMLDIIYFYKVFFSYDFIFIIFKKLIVRAKLFCQDFQFLLPVCNFLTKQKIYLPLKFSYVLPMLVSCEPWDNHTPGKCTSPVQPKPGLSYTMEMRLPGVA